MKLRHILLATIAGILLAACNQTLAADVTPPPGYVPPTPVPTLGPLYPDQAPDIENGKVIYAEKCAACHGDTGLGNGSQSADLPVSVIPIGLPEFANDATPSAWYTVVTQGRLERYMPPFASLTDQERWDVVSYALTLHTTPEQIELGKTIFEEKCADCGDAFTNVEMMSALSKTDIVKMIRTGSGGFPAFGSDLSDDEASAAAAYIRTLSFAVPAAPVAVEATEAPVTAEAVSTPGEGTAVEGTPEATEAPAASVITGSIENRTGKDLPADLTITLRGFDHGADPAAVPTEILNTQGEVNPDGSYAFDAELVENQIYLAELTFEGISYQTEFMVVPAGATELVLAPIVVYNTTEDLGSLQVEELQIFFDMAGEETQVFAVFFVMNTSDTTVLIPMADEKTIPFITFPEGATGLGYETTDNSAAFVATENGFAIPPSENAYGLIAFSTLPKGETNVIQNTTLPINIITLYLPEGVDAEGATLTDTGIQDLQGTKFHIYNAAPVAKNGALEFTLSGKPATVAESADITQNQTVLIGIGALGVTLILAGIFLYWRDRNKEEDEDDEEAEDEDDMYEDTESIMDAIIALDDLHRNGKLKDEAYNKRRAELMDALKKRN